MPAITVMSRTSHPNMTACDVLIDGHPFRAWIYDRMAFLTTGEAGAERVWASLELADLLSTHETAILNALYEAMMEERCQLPTA